MTEQKLTKAKIKKKYLKFLFKFRIDCVSMIFEVIWNLS